MSNIRQPKVEELQPLATKKLASEAVIWTSEEILKGTKEIQIIHRNDVYRLRLTRNDKLILSK